MIDIKKIQKEKPISELIKFAIINIDKPTGPTSFTVSSFVREALQLNKTSHFGTLDPMVTGVLPVALGRACRLNEYFMHRDKEYIGVMHIHEPLEEKKLRETIKKFIGKITQLPPVRSRVKRAERVREIKSFEIIEIDGQDVLFKTEVQAGTYIRKLIHDIGEQIGGAHMTELRRTKAGFFTEDSSIDMYEFEKAVLEYKKGNDTLLRNILIPAEVVSQVIPVVQAKGYALKALLTGKPLFKKDIQGKFDLEEGDKFVLFIGEQIIGCYVTKILGDIVGKPEFVIN